MRVCGGECGDVAAAKGNLLISVADGDCVCLQVLGIIWVAKPRVEAMISAMSEASDGRENRRRTVNRIM